MKSSDTPYARTQPGRAAARSALAWIKSVERKSNKENACDPVILRLKRTRPAQIGCQIEDIDQETQRLLGSVKALQAQNARLQKAVEAELAEVALLEDQLIQGASARPPSLARAGRRPASPASCLAQNYNRALWLAEQEREQKAEELQALEATPAVREYARRAAVVSALQAEAAELARLRDHHAARSQAGARGRRERLRAQIDQRRAAIRALEGDIAAADELAAGRGPVEEREARRAQRLRKALSAQQRLNGDLRRRTQRLQSGANGFEEYCEEFDERDLESSAVRAFFLYLVVYLQKHGLTAAFVREVLEEATGADDARAFAKALRFHLGLRDVDEGRTRLFSLLALRSTPELALFKFVAFRDELARAPCGRGPPIAVPRAGSLFAFLLERVEQGRVGLAELLRAVLGQRLDGRFDDLGRFGEVPGSNEASLVAEQGSGLF